MNRERAETYLWQLAEAELRRARTLPAASFRTRQDTARLALVAEALVAVGAVDVGTADQIRADLELAVAVRQPGQVDQASPGQRGLSPDARMRLARLMHSPPRRTATAALPVSGLSAGHTRPASQRASWRAVPVGQVIRIRDGGIRRELLVVAYVQSADGARFTTAGWPFSPFTPFTAADDRGASYQISFLGELRPRELLLRPDPLHQIRWLDLITTPGEPATRIDLDPPSPAPQVTVTPNARSPGELLRDVIAARILTWAAAFPHDNPRQPAANAHLRAFASDGPGDIVAALHAADALSPASPVPGQLAGLCARLGIPGHGITAPSADDLPERWRSMLIRYHRRKPQAGLAPGILAATVARLPELDDAEIAILGLHHDEHGTIVHMLASGVTLEGGWPYARGVRPLPVLWMCDSSGRWHTTRTNGVSPMWGDPREVMLWLAIMPPLDRGTAWIDVVTTGSSAQVRVRLPLRWK